MKGKLKIVGVIVLAIVIIVLVLQNTETVRTKIFFVTIEMPRAVLLFVTWLVGVAVGLLLALPKVGKKEKES